MSNIKVELNSVYPSGDIRAYATVTVEDRLSIRGIKLMDDGNDNVYLEMPSRKIAGSMKEICFADAEFKDQLREAVQDAYYAVAVPAYDAEQEFELEEIPEEENDMEERYEIQMENIDVKIGSVYPSTENSGIRAFAVATIDDSIGIRSIKIVEGGDGLFVAVPSRKTVDGYKDVCSLMTVEYKEMFNKAVLDSYHQTIAQSQEEEMDDEQEQEQEENNSMEMGSM